MGVDFPMPDQMLEVSSSKFIKDLGRYHWKEENHYWIQVQVVEKLDENNWLLQIGNTYLMIEWKSYPYETYTSETKLILSLKLPNKAEVV